MRSNGPSQCPAGGSCFLTQGWRARRSGRLRRARALPCSSSSQTTLFTGQSHRIVTSPTNNMTPTNKQSPRVEFHTPTQQAPHDKPSPLRIVKRRSAHLESSTEEMAPFGDGSPEFLDKKFPLKMVKRRGRRRAPALMSDELATDGWEQNPGYRPSFWSSSVELSRPRGRVWGETLTRCRGLLTKSTPFLKDSRQSQTLGRSAAHRTASSGSSILDYADYTPSNGTPSNGPPSSRRSLGARPVERPVSPLYKLPMPLQSTQPPDFSRAAHPFVLSPSISVVSQCTGQEAGRQTVWATVEVSGRLSRIPSSRSPSGSSQETSVSRGSFVDHQLGNVTSAASRHGYPD